MRESSAGRRTPGHMSGLDGLRALAIIGVTLFHMFPETIRGGYLGVSLFFVLSGYLLVITSERRAQAGSWKILPYYGKRVKRIYPGLLIMLFVTIGAYFFLDRQAIAGIRPELRSIVFGYNNWWQIAQNADYFTRITNASPFTPMWFLAIELQFYLLWPLIFGVVLLLNRKRGDRGGLLFLGILTMLSAVLTPVLYRPEADVTRLYYGTDTRIYGLLFGVLLGMLQTRGMIPQLREKTAKRTALPLLAGLLTVTCIAYKLMSGQKAFAYRGGMLLMTLLFGVLLLLVTDSRLPVGEWLEVRPLTWIGRNSYEIYLWQYPVIYLFMVKRWNGNPVFYVLQLALICVLAAWLHWLTGVISNLRIPASLEDASAARRYGTLAAAGLTVFLVFAGVAGAATAPVEKFAQKDELEQRLAENQRMLQEMQDGSGTAGSSSRTGQSSAAMVRSGGGNAGGIDQTGSSNTAGAGKAAGSGSEPQYADPNLTNGAVVSTERVLLLGDSIMLDSSPQIKDQLPDCYIDAVQSRQVSEGPDDVAWLRNEGHLNHTLVISLGTNGPIEEDEVRSIMHEAGSDTSVFWVNLFGRTVTWEKESNRLLNRLADEFPNLSVIDWCSLIKQHPEWLWDDGEHPNPEGSEGYALLIRQSLETAMEAQAGQELTQESPKTGEQARAQGN